LETTNGGLNFTNVGLQGAKHAAFLSVRMGTPNFGVAGALGFIGMPCGAYTTNGKDWQVTHDGTDILCAFQSVSAFNDGKTLALIGAWSTPGQWEGNGVQFSTNSGQTWVGNNWPWKTTPARYGDFLSANWGLVTGGTWPEESAAPKSFGKTGFRLTERLSFDGKRFHINPIPPRTPGNIIISGYQAVITQASNNAASYAVLLNLTGQANVYFNEISCTDENHCWAAAEGQSLSLQTAAYIYATTNGGKTWSTQLTAVNGSIIAIQMANSTYGWAGGGLMNGNEIESGQFWQTIDGVTWQVYQQLKDFYVTDISTIDSSVSYATGISPVGLSSFAKFQS